LVIRPKKQKRCQPNELTQGDCWIGIAQASSSGLILAARVGKHTDQFIEELIVNTEGKTNCKQWHTDNWGGYERVLTNEVTHIIGKDQTQQLERTNGIVRQQTGRWHRKQNKFAKAWQQTQATVRLVVSYFNWIWIHSRKGNTAAQRAGLAIAPWSWHDLISYPTLC
jgi:insertion element IS1 protein InsB